MDIIRVILFGMVYSFIGIGVIVCLDKLINNR